NGRGQILSAEYQSRARTAQGFVGSGGGDMRVGHGRGVRAAGNKAGDVGHVEDEGCADFVGDTAHALEIPEAGIGAAASDNDVGFLADCGGFHLVVVDLLRIAPHVVEGGAIELSAETELVAVGEVAAMRKIKTENGVARVEHREIG